MCETFVWNLKDLVVTPEHFAQILVEDYNLCYLAPTYHQTSDFKAHTVNYDGDEDEAGDVSSLLFGGFRCEELIK
ncbi:hypothetical protein F5887DRAFT_891932 [Amanita rubescens]|nr:hypothetical protein F5887DRAFT_891932 [Amanita rubescens]